MDTADLIQNVLTSLAIQSPMFLVYLIAAVLSLVFWKRCAKASILLMLAVAMLVVLDVAQTAGTQYLVFRVRTEWDWPAGRLVTVTRLIAVVGSLLRAGAMGLWTAAVFVGRRRNEHRSA